MIALLTHPHPKTFSVLGPDNQLIIAGRDTEHSTVIYRSFLTPNEQLHVQSQQMKAELSNTLCVITHKTQQKEPYKRKSINPSLTDSS